MAEIERVMTESAQRVLETMFFTELLGPGQPGPPEEQVAARLSFHGNPSGVFGASLSLEQAKLLAAGFLGMEDKEVSEARAGEVVCELANMLCGTLLSRVESDAGFALAPPSLVPPQEVLEGRAAPLSAQVLKAARLSFEMETGSMTLALELWPPQ